MVSGQWRVESGGRRDHPREKKTQEKRIDPRDQRPKRKEAITKTQEKRKPTHVCIRDATQEVEVAVWCAARV